MADPQRVRGVGKPVEIGDLGRGERTTLERQAKPGRGRQGIQIRRVDRAQVALGGHVQANRLDDLGREVCGKGGGRQLVVMVVDPLLCAILVELVQQMPIVVQQRCRDEALRRTGRFGQVGGLERVLELRDLLAAIQVPAITAINDDSVATPYVQAIAACAS